MLDDDSICSFISMFMNILLNCHENVFLLRCLFFSFLACAILSTLFILTPYFSILNKYRLEAFEELKAKLANLHYQDKVCLHISLGIVLSS